MPFSRVSNVAVIGLLTISSGAVAGHPRTSGRGRGMPNVPGRDSLNYPIQFHKMHPVKRTPNNPALLAAQARSLETLKADLDAITTKGAATPAQKAALRDALLAVVDGSHKPASAAVQGLSDGLADALSHRTPDGLDSAKLAQHLKTVMNSAYVPGVNVHKAIREGEGLLSARGGDAARARAVADALNAIAAQANAHGKPGMIE